VDSRLRLPADVRSAAQAALGAKRFRTEFAWLSWAGTVWRLAGGSGAVYLKRAADLSAERERIGWLAGRLPVPEVVGFVHARGDDWLLTRELLGVPLHHASLGLGPRRVARRFGEILEEIHSADAFGCPFGEAVPGHVFIHGDYCLPNVLVEQGRLAGLVDLGRAGLGDPRDDLAAGVWTLQYSFGRGYAPEFLDAYGAPPMTDGEIERLRRRYTRPYMGRTVSTARQQYQAAIDR
jgi:kanamycin kinase/aminoglycoside 3'-phosphotransferase-2